LLDIRDYGSFGDVEGVVFRQMSRSKSRVIKNWAKKPAARTRLDVGVRSSTYRTCFAITRLARSF
jgi:hypothetical protein